MGIMDIQIPTVDVKVAGGSFAVRGLSLDDLEFLLREHGGDLERIFEMFNGTDPKADAAAQEAMAQAVSGDIKSMAMKVIREVPGLVAAGIALAADEHEPESIARVRKFSITTQYNALMAIAGLTFNAEGDSKKVFGVLLQFLQGFNDHLGQQASQLAAATKVPSQPAPSFGASEGTSAS